MNPLMWFGINVKSLHTFSILNQVLAVPKHNHKKAINVMLLQADTALQDWKQKTN